jgi:hypothetical protein
MEYTNAANEFVGTTTFTAIAVAVIIIIAIFLRVVFGPTDSGYRHMSDR